MERLLSEYSVRRLWAFAIVLLALGAALAGVAVSYAGGSAGAFDAGAISGGDTAWVLASAALVMLMTPAVGFFYGGMVSSKNVVSVLKQSLLILGLVSVQWVVIGYSLAFGPDVHGIIGNLSHAWLWGVGYAPNSDYAATIPATAFMMFQAMFAIVTPALIIGAFVGRIRFKALVLFTLLWTTLVYDPLAHWVWGVGGWIRALGALDFAGGTVVHMSAGFSALAAALVIGKRLKEDHVPNANVPFVILGAALLWFGWFGFNAGSALGANALAVSAFLVTNTAAAASALAWVALSWAEKGKPSAIAASIGAVCGLVAITPASGFVGPVSAIAIGVIAGVCTYLAVHIRSSRIAIDDTLDVWAGHGVGGLVGALLTGVFAEVAVNSAGANGLLFGNPHQLSLQFLAVAASGIYAFAMTWIILKVMGMLHVSLRVSSEQEEEGLDMAVHGEPAYGTRE